MAKSSKRLGVGVIGLGMGGAHLAEYAECGRARIAAICDVDGKRLAETAARFDLTEDQCFTDYRKMFSRAGKPGLEAVSVALPNALHAPVTIAAFKAGLHVLCEKPMAMNAGEARRMISAADKARRKLMINLSYRFTQQSQALKRAVDSGVLGKVYFARTAWHRRRGIPGFGGWFGQKKLAGGGPIIDLGVHRLDLAMWLMGSPWPVSVSGSTFGHLGRRLAREQGKRFDVEDLGCALVRFDNGATLILEASWAGFGEKQEDMITHLYGTTGGLVQRNVGEGYEFGAFVYTERDGAMWQQKLQQPTCPCPTAGSEFTDAVLDGHATPTTGRDGLAVQIVLDAIYRSAELGKEVKIPPAR